jgi:hypothetical protein
MRGESMSGTTVTGTTLLRLALLFHLLRGVLIGLEVLGHRRLDLSLLDPREVVENVPSEVQVMEIMTGELEVAVIFTNLEVVPREEEVVAMDIAVVALSPAGWTTHVFTLVVFVPPRSIGALLLILS